MAQEGHPTPWPARLRVGVASTGDEIVTDPAPHQIRDANGPMLVALAEALGADARLLAPLPDDTESLKAALGACAHLDILMTSGGVSMGEKDHLPKVLVDLGATVLFHRVDLRPGKPMLVALLGNLLVLGLPGNPVSSYVNARLFLEVALARLQGRPWPQPWHEAPLLADQPNPGPRPLLQPCQLREEGLQPLRSQGSADLAALAKADACAWIPPGGATAGSTVRWISVV
jgi:molybdopterin molybdotransferase